MYLYMGRLILLSTDEQKKVTLIIKTNVTFYLVSVIRTILKMLYLVAFHR